VFKLPMGGGSLAWGQSERSDYPRKNLADLRRNTGREDGAGRHRDKRREERVFDQILAFPVFYDPAAINAKDAVCRSHVRVS
jgi:hypothetical protein